MQVPLRRGGRWQMYSGMRPRFCATRLDDETATQTPQVARPAEQVDGSVLRRTAGQLTVMNRTALPSAHHASARGDALPEASSSMMMRSRLVVRIQSDSAGRSLGAHLPQSFFCASCSGLSNALIAVSRASIPVRTVDGAQQTTMPGARPSARREVP